jgi:hypothetical protein
MNIEHATQISRASARGGPTDDHRLSSLRYFWQYLVVSLLYRLVLYILEADLGKPDPTRRAE